MTIARGEHRQRAIIVRDQRTAGSGVARTCQLASPTLRAPDQCGAVIESRRRTRLPLLRTRIGNACRLPGAARVGG